MSTTHCYTYTVLRYVHDISTGEFINVGVAMHAPSAAFTKIICRHTYGRVSKVFPGVKADHFKFLMRQIEKDFNNVGHEIIHNLPLRDFRSVLEVAKSILPDDDGSLQWAPVGAGRTPDPSVALDNLFNRLVARYDEKNTQDRRSEDEVWRHFKRSLEAKQLLHHFEPKKIASEDDEVEFQHTWKNGVLHCLEPVSFDLSSADSIKDKAHKWLGRITSVMRSSEKFCVYFLVGQPQDETLARAYDSALKILQKIPVDNKIYFEQDAERLSECFAEQMAAHSEQIRQLH